jgi:hypothetical protein
VVGPAGVALDVGACDVTTEGGGCSKGGTAAQPADLWNAEHVTLRLAERDASVVVRDEAHLWRSPEISGGCCYLLLSVGAVGW